MPQPGNATLAGLPLLAAPAAAQVAPAPTPTPGFALEPLLPREGLLRGDTWLGVGARLLARAVDYLPSLVAAVVVLALFVVASRLVARLVRGVLGRSHVDPALVQILQPLARYTVLALGIIMALSQAGLQVGSLLAGVGVAGLAIGLAAQDTLANIVAGFTLLWDRPFRIGDRVTIAETYGEVMQIGLRSTRLRTLEQLDVVLPNKEVVNQTIINHTLTPNLRLAVPLSIAYKEDTRRAREVLVGAVAEHPRIRREPGPEVVVTELADSGVALELRVWLRDPHTERATLFALLEAAKIALDQAGIEIPFPQRTVHFAAASPPLQLQVERPRADGSPAPAGGRRRRDPAVETGDPKPP